MNFGVSANEMSQKVSMALDTVLDRTLALGYGSTGLSIRKRLPSWPSDLPRMDGKVALVTGSGSGIGLATCKGFADLGASVRALARDGQRAARAAAEIRAASPDADVRGVACDLSSLRAVSTFAHRFAAEEPRLDVLVNNAGVMPDQRERSADGNELMFATHVLAPFALTSMLAGLLSRSAPARVINVSSGGMYSQSLPAGDLQSERTRYSPARIYARTKREQVVISEQWAERLRGSGVVVHAMHPGWVDTQGLQQSLPVFSFLTRPIVRTPEQGADTIVWLGAAPSALRSTGKFWHDRRERPTHYALGASDDSFYDRQELWNLCESLLARARANTPELAARAHMSRGDRGRR